MDWKLELVVIPVSDADRAKAFYTEKVGFNADQDTRVSDKMRVVQLTSPGSACSIAIGTRLADMPPGSVQGLQLVVSDIEAARRTRRARGRGQRGPGDRRGNVGQCEPAVRRLGLVRILQRSGQERLGRAAGRRSR